MSLNRDQIVHELTMACVKGMIQDKVISENNDESPDVNVKDLAKIAIKTYNAARKIIGSDFID